jgi:hypothetical protein
MITKLDGPALSPRSSEQEVLKPCFKTFFQENMEDRRTIDNLSELLETLQVRVAQLETAVRQPNTDSKSLQVRVAQLETAAPQPNTNSATVRTATSGFNRGDRVWIKNKLKKPATWSNEVPWKEDEAKTATVSHIYKGQVHFVTDNGVKTWRAVNNLKRID